MAGRERHNQQLSDSEIELSNRIKLRAQDIIHGKAAAAALVVRRS